MRSPSVVLAESEAQPGEVLVRFEADVSSQAIATINRDLQTSVIEVIPELDIYRLRTPEKTSIGEMVDRYQNTAGVMYAEPNYIVRALETFPDDPRLGEQWALDTIEAPIAWDVTTGIGHVVVAIIDTGIDYTHPDLGGGRFIGGYDFVNGDDDPMDDEGHGTHVTGIATADTDNNVGIAGLTWNSQFMGVKVLDAMGSGTDFGVAQGIVYAVNEGARVANLSLGGDSSSQALEDAVRHAYRAGVVLACAAGNGYGPGVVYPAAYDPYCLGVAATDRNDQRAAFSSYGPEVDVAAPGVDILSTTGPGYESWDGTSMATPHVTGLAALILAHDPGLSVDQVFDAIRDAAEDVNAATHPGEDDYLGMGRINACRALASSVDLEPPYVDVGSGSVFTLTVFARNSSDLGGFQFDLAYALGCVQAVDVVLGPFLGSTGRSVTPMEPTFGDGIVTFGASSSGANPGPSGEGALAAVTFQAGMGDCCSNLDLQNVAMMDTVDNQQSACTGLGTVCVAGSAACPDPNCPEDVNCDGVVDRRDLRQVRRHIGQSCPTR